VKFLLNLRAFAPALILTLLFSAILPSVALADEGDPPPTEEPAPPPADEGVSEGGSEANVSNDEIAYDNSEQATAISEETSLDSAEETPVESADLAEVLDAIPQGTEVILVDENGDALSLASEDAVEALYSGDPMWCPASVAIPIEGPLGPWAGGCSPSFAKFNGIGGLLEWLDSEDPGVAGIIWIEGSYDSSLLSDGDVNIDPILGGFPLTGAVNLTLKGGWNGCNPTCVGTIDTTNPSEFNGSLSIVNWAANVTLSDILVTGADTNPNGAVYLGVEVPALYVQTSGNITLTRVESSENQGGADEMSGAFLNPTGAGVVTVTESRFNNNDNHGLIIYSIISANSVTLKNVTANENDSADGVLIANNWGIIAKPVAVTNSSFNQNGLNGLSVLSRGAVTLANISAALNGESGVTINNCDGIPTCFGIGPVKVNGFNNFSDNSGTGLFVKSNGAITVNQTVANDNGENGVYLENAFASLPQNVTILGFLTAQSNAFEGLDVLSNGAVAAANLTMGDNGYQGAQIINTNAITPKPVTLTGTNFFIDNGYEGLYVSSPGAITVNNITALRNGFIGGDVYGSGIYLFNAITPSVQQNVIVNGTNVFNSNYTNGLRILSYGSVTLNALTANNNGEGIDDSSGNGVIIANEGGSAIKPVLIKGNNRFNLNDGFGLYVLSDGAVTLNNLTANENGANGVGVENYAPLTYKGNVYLTGVNNFAHNAGYGLEVRSDGAISVSKVTANWNGSTGVYLENTAAPSPQNISILGFLTAGNNSGSGLIANSIGAILAANITALDNTWEGGYLFNGDSPSPKAVSITGLNVFTYNGLDGLEIQSNGVVTVSNVTASGNVWSGLIIFNRDTSTVQQNVTLSGLNVMNGNGQTGVDIDSYGAVTLSNVTANLNGNPSPGDGYGDGANIENSGGLYAKPVLLTGINTFNGNDEDGLEIVSDGAITVYKVNASYNGNNGNSGAELDNQVSELVQSKVTIVGYGVFEWNGGAGLVVTSNGAILTNNLNASHNLGNGANLFTIGITAPQTVTLNGTNNFGFNDGTGLLVNSDGSIKVNNLTASNNSWTGADLDNYTNWFNNPGGPFASFGSITLSGFGYFTDNAYGDGLIVQSNGSVSLARVMADSNGNDIGDFGIVIQATGNIILVCSTAFDNFGGGLWVRDAASGQYMGILTLKGFYASFNNPGYDEDIGTTIPIRTICP
jgi:hypothetical protein